LNDQTRYQLLRILENSPDVSQRELARRLGLSLGTTNYCLRAVMEKGWVKARNFRNSSNKAAYMYVLTPKGISAKARITKRFLDRKIEEYEQLKVEIEELRAQVESR
jgi:EPS-associated MarR family transcriptional regulator